MARNVAPTHRGQPQMRARLNVIESLLADRALTIEEIRVAMRREHGIDVHVSTTRAYVQALVDEGRVLWRKVRTAASPTGVHLAHTHSTPAAVIDEAVATLQAQGGVFHRGPGARLPSRRQVVQRAR